jgi:hypothetical protein
MTAEQPLAEQASALAPEHDERQACSVPPGLLYEISDTATKLDLSKCGLVVFPAAVCGLTALRDLSIAHNKLSDLPGCAS